MFVKLWWVPVAALVMAASAAPGGAQVLGGSPNALDASVPAQGIVRLQALTSWTRFDQLYGLSTDGTTRPLGALLSSDSLGVAQIPALAPNETALRSLAGNPDVRLSLGRLVTNANSRIAETPVELQYGLTSRIAVSVMVPLVMTRTTVIASMNGRCRFASCAPLGRLGNVGLNPARYTETTALQNQLTVAIEAMQKALASCQSNPGAAGCQNLLAHAADAQQLDAAAAAFATSLGAVYGTGSTQPGQKFVPLAGSSLEALVKGQLSSLAGQYQALLPPDQQVTIGGSLPDAAGPIGVNEFQQVVGPGYGIGIDSIATTKRIGIGDIELGVAYRLFDRLSDTAAARTSRFGARAAVQAIVRLGTGAPPDPTLPFDLGTGQGQTDLEGRAALDIRAGSRLGATIAGIYTSSLTSAQLHRAPAAGGELFPLAPPVPASWKPGNVYQIDIGPRFLATRYFQISGHYTIRHETADLVTPTAAAPDTMLDLSLQTPLAPWVSRPATTDQRLGFAFTYSTLDSYARGTSPLPLEMTWVHQQTIRATGIVPQYFRDQVQFRLYYQLRRHGP